MRRIASFVGRKHCQRTSERVQSTLVTATACTLKRSILSVPLILATRAEQRWDGANSNNPEAKTASNNWEALVCHGHISHIVGLAQKWPQPSPRIHEPSLLLT